MVSCAFFVHKQCHGAVHSCKLSVAALRGARWRHAPVFAFILYLLAQRFYSDAAKAQVDFVLATWTVNTLMQMGAHFVLLRSGFSDIHETSVQVCVDNFDASCIERMTSYTDTRTGRVIEVTLPVPRLRPLPVPTVIPGSPSYL